MFSKLIFILFSLLPLQFFAQEHNIFHQSLVDQVSHNNLVNHLNEFEDFGIKTLGSTAEQNTLNWLIAHYESWGYTNIETQEVSAFGYSGYNLIVTKEGTVYPDTYVVIDAHYDTVNGPGVNDNGSGTSVLLEIARILANIQTEYSIKFIHFTAEEWGLIGSQKYVEEIVVPQDLDIKLVFNIDEVGGIAGIVNNKITCERDESQPYFNNEESALITLELANCMELYSNLETTFSNAYGSDYVPFQLNGYVITGLYEFNESPYPHTPQDTLENMDTEYVYQVTKGALGALAYFAGAFQELSVKDITQKEGMIYPNPAAQFIQIPSQNINKTLLFELYDEQGRLVQTKRKNGNQTFRWDLSLLPNGIYFLKFNQYSKKIIVQHK